MDNAPSSSKSRLQKSLRIIHGIASPFALFLYPRLCEICGTTIKSGAFCSTCRDSLFVNIDSRVACPHCGQNPNRRKCSCDVAPSHIASSITAIFDYDDNVRKIVHGLKYKGSWKLGASLGREFAPRIPAHIFSADIATSVPIHKSRRNVRGYNQAEKLATGILSSIDNAPEYRDILMRTKFVKSQTSLDRSKRGKNQDVTFSIKPDTDIKGKSVLLFDDVVTTGATVDTCAKVLLDAGAVRVDVLCIARD